MTTSIARLKMSRFAEESGVPIPTIKHYVREGLLPEPKRTSKTMAYYDAALVPRVKAIKRLQETLHLPLVVIGQLLDRIDDEPIPNERAIEATIARVLGELAPREVVTRSHLIASGVDRTDLELFEALGIVTPESREGESTYVGDDVALLRLLAEARKAGLSPTMLPPEILRSYVAALRELVRVELQMFKAGVVPIAGPDLGRLTEVATTLSERLVVLLRRKLLLPTLRTLTAFLFMIVSFACAADPDSVATTSTPGSTSATNDDEGDTIVVTLATDPDSGADTASSASASAGDDGVSTTNPDNDSSASSSDSSSTGDAERMGPDFREPGPHAITTTPGSAALPGCTMDYDVFAPTDVDDPPTVVLAHGFMGTRASMVGWAAHWASWGLRVVTPNLCHASIVDADHAQNGLDLVGLAAELDLAAPLFAGYSAGGLAAVLAASDVASTTALLGLDMVDSGELGATAAADITVPAADIVAEPAMCNSSGNGSNVFAAMPDARRLRVVEGDHCDFQSPGDIFCGTCSAPNAEQTPETIQATIRGLSTAFLLWQSELDASGEQWWTEGASWYVTLADAGAITSP